MKKTLQPPCGRRKTGQPPWRAREIPPFGGWRHHLPAPLGSVSLDSQSPTALCESSSLATTSWWDYGCLTIGKHRNLFCPLNRGKSGEAG